MACDRYCELLSARLDGELTAKEAEELEAHLAVCPSCRALAERLDALRIGFGALEEEPAPNGLVRDIMARIPGKKPVPLFRRPQVRALAGLAACLVICAGVWRTGLPVRDADRTTASVPTAFGVPDAPGYSEQADLSSPLRSAAPQVKSSGTYEAPPETEETVLDQEEPEKSPAIQSAGAAVQNSSAETETEEDKSEDTTAAPQQEEPAAASAPPEEAAVPDALAVPFAIDAAPDEPLMAVSYSFENPQYLRVTYGTTPAAPSARIIGSTDSLASLLSQFPMDDLSEVSDGYDAEFFKEKRLLAIVLEESGGSVRHQLDPQGLTQDSVTVRRQVPQAGTCDMAAWLILAEVGPSFADGQELTVVLVS